MVNAQVDLKKYQWEKRLILLFAPSPQEQAYREQVAVLEGSSGGLLERDLLIAHLFETGSGQLGDDMLSENKAASLRSEYEVGGEFTLILIGKDGTVKRRSQEVVPVEELFAQIDSMPMRQREMGE